MDSIAIEFTDRGELKLEIMRNDYQETLDNAVVDSEKGN